jgi:hypothetical protein
MLQIRLYRHKKLLSLKEEVQKPSILHSTFAHCTTPFRFSDRQEQDLSFGTTMGTIIPRIPSRAYTAPICLFSHHHALNHLSAPRRQPQTTPNAPGGTSSAASTASTTSPHLLNSLHGAISAAGAVSPSSLSLSWHCQTARVKLIDGEDGTDTAADPKKPNDSAELP